MKIVTYKEIEEATNSYVARQFKKWYTSTDSKGHKLLWENDLFVFVGFIRIARGTLQPEFVGYKWIKDAYDFESIILPGDFIHSVREMLK